MDEMPNLKTALELAFTVSIETIIVNESTNKYTVGLDNKYFGFGESVDEATDNALKRWRHDYDRRMRQLGFTVTPTS